MKEFVFLPESEVPFKLVHNLDKALILPEPQTPHLQNT